MEEWRWRAVHLPRRVSMFDWHHVGWRTTADQSDAAAVRWLRTKSRPTERLTVASADWQRWSSTKTIAKRRSHLALRHQGQPTLALTREVRDHRPHQAR